MKVVRNDTPRWTREHLEHYRKYREVYGWGLTAAEYERESGLLVQGCPGHRYGEETECYDIYAENGDLAGEITLALTDLVPELGIAVFDRYRGRGYARQALAMLAELWAKKYSVIEAVIKADNPAGNTVRDILESGGFVFKCKLPGGGLLFVLDFGTAEKVASFT